jgi:hypothetical protein
MSVNNIAAENAIQYRWRHLYSPRGEMASSKNKNFEYLFTDCRMVSIGPKEYVAPIKTSANMVKTGTVIGLFRSTRQRSRKFPEIIVKIRVNASRVFAAPNFIGKRREKRQRVSLGEVQGAAYHTARDVTLDFADCCQTFTSSDT